MNIIDLYIFWLVPKSGKYIYLNINILGFLLPPKRTLTCLQFGVSDLEILSDSLMEWRDAIKFKNRENASMFAA
jgi:hypothetical protein